MNATNYSHDISIAPFLWRRMKGRTLLIICLYSFPLFSQEIKKGDVYNYARKIVDTMASASMHGRGYVNDGDKIAANYIKTEFQKHGLKSFGDDYYQKFSFPVNTFPGEIYFRIDEKYATLTDATKWVPGKNYLVGCSNSNIKTDFTTFFFDSTFVSDESKFNSFKKLNNLKKTYLIFDARNIKDKTKKAYYQKVRDNYFNASGIIEVVDKLTWEISQDCKPFPYIQILSEGRSFSKALDGTIEIKNKFIRKNQSQNVIGFIQGSEQPDSFLVFTAHYDHLGRMGKDVYFPGANDNASGCAMLLNLASYYAMPEHKPKCSIAFIAFTAEEVGLLGSKYYTEHPLFPLNNIKFLLNMDIMGTGEEGITAVNGSIFKKEFDALKRINTENLFIKDVKIRGKAANSDHYYFSEKGVKAFFIYAMGGIKAYHDIHDKAETLPLNEFENLFKLITKFGDYLQD